ncbi:MAG: hypothetical protein HC769_07665 [Cyanobacteria bacterium CRU_2_1]|nr:hypothetical protein [Cyanobacteria bacterium CRU_2_1]
MTKAFHVLTAAGFAATLMAAIVGCSQAPEPNTSDSQSDSQDATTEQAATEDGSAESAPRKMISESSIL